MAMLLALHQHAHARALRRERVFREHKNPFEELNDTSMYEDYRFIRMGVIKLIDILTPYLEQPTRRSHAIPASTQVFIALRFYASGLLRDAKNSFLHPVSKATASRVVRRVTLALCNMKDDYIKFPTTARDLQQTKADFFAVAGFPGVVGAVDGTLVGLHGCPYGPNEYVYISRKNKHAINVQLICNAKYHITNCVARWPGSTHDARILTTSLIGRHFNAGRLDGILLGDSGYPLRPWLMTPLLDPQTPAETAYNGAQTTTRNLIEQVNGQLKNKFRCILGDGLQIEPTRACDIIVACCVLFNISKELKEPHLDHMNDRVVERDPDDPDGAYEDNVAGAAARADIITNFFLE